MKKILCFIVALFLLINTTVIAEHIEFSLTSSQNTSELTTERLLETAGIITMIGIAIGVSGQLCGISPIAYFGQNIAVGASLCFVINLVVYSLTVRQQRNELESNLNSNPDKRN